MSVYPPEAEVVENLRGALLEHYDRTGRSLPWRSESDPYRILVSEVMLQQTRVETVLEYYGRWLALFPDLEALAGADTADVMKAWEGLGYYRRARNLQAAARVVRESGGTLPSSYESLKALPGVGAYTAGAVASIAFGHAVGAVDGNVRRVLARLFGMQEPSAAWLRRAADELVDPTRPGDWNQALMDLGATVCGPRRPRCEGCPLAAWCTGRESGRPEYYPAAKPKAGPRKATFALAVLCAGGRTLLVRRPDDGLLGGLWAFPEAEIERPGDGPAAVHRLTRELDVRPEGDPVALPTVEHRFTHIRAVYLPWQVAVSDFRAAGGRRWVDPRERTSFAVPVAQRKVLDGLAGTLLRN